MHEEHNLKDVSQAKDYVYAMHLNKGYMCRFSNNWSTKEKLM